VVSDSSLIRIIDPLMAQVTVPLNEEIGPPQPEPEPTKKKSQ
jgi:hypothetical protein